MGDASLDRHIDRIRVWLVGAVLGMHAGLTQAADSAAGAAAVPALDVEPFAAAGVGRLLLGLLVVVALMMSLAWLMRRMGGFTRAAAGSLRVLGGLSLGTRERVVLIQIGETQLLLGVAPGRVQTLHVLEHPISIQESNQSDKGPFAAALGAALQRGKQS